ncbi:helix-turn-helix domain-containing protein [Sphingomonas sp. LR59]|uniref:helix-turn-helix domain-containing protein n=1 Tax=Sphingomonas sp. LR59 TaxID=3050232 RepID=UPI003FA74EE5
MDRTRGLIPGCPTPTKNGQQVHLCDPLRWGRRRLGSTLAELARRSGVSASQLSRIERGEVTAPRCSSGSRKTETSFVKIGGLCSATRSSLRSRGANCAAPHSDLGADRSCNLCTVRSSGAGSSLMPTPTQSAFLGCSGSTIVVMNQPK